MPPRCCSALFEYLSDWLCGVRAHPPTVLGHVMGTSLFCCPPWGPGRRPVWEARPSSLLGGERPPARAVSHRHARLETLSWSLPAGPAPSTAPIGGGGGVLLAVTACCGRQGPFRAWHLAACRRAGAPVSSLTASTLRGPRGAARAPEPPPLAASSLLPLLLGCTHHTPFLTEQFFLSVLILLLQQLLGSLPVGGGVG